MWPVRQPAVNASESFRRCTSRIKDARLRERLKQIRPAIVAAEQDYAQKAASGQLDQVAPHDNIGNIVSKLEMTKLYDYRMAAKNAVGRKIYDALKLLPEEDRCPFCDQRNISTLDHLLPKSVYPSLAVTPVNLVGCCAECNKAKLNAVPNTPGTAFLHPYYDDVSTVPWLQARVVQQVPCAVMFTVVRDPQWSVVLGDRVVHQFKSLKLASLYAIEAARELSNIRFGLRQHFADGGAAAVQAELTRQWASRRQHRLNSWQTATYQAFAHDAWFYGGGFDAQ